MLPLISASSGNIIFLLFLFSAFGEFFRDVAEILMVCFLPRFVLRDQERENCGQ